MKILKALGGIVGLLLLVFVVLCLIGPKNYELTRSKEMLATPEQIYPMVANYSNWPSWSPWTEMDQSAKYTMEGMDGTVGAKYSWVGDPKLTGEGYMVTTGLEENKKLMQDLVFTSPRQGTSQVEFLLDSVGENRTKTTWLFKQDFGFIERGMMTFFKGAMEEQLTKSFDRGLVKMDSVIESKIHYEEM